MQHFKNEGGNKLVEENRGVKHRDIEIEQVLKDIQCDQTEVADLRNYEEELASIDAEEEVEFQEI